MIKIDSYGYERRKYNTRNVSFKGININRYIYKAVKEADAFDKTGGSDSIIQLLRRCRKYIFKSTGEMPIADKPIIARLHTNEKMQKALNDKSENDVQVHFFRKDSEKALKDANCIIEKGDIDEKGHLTMAGKEKIEKAKPSFKAASEDGIDLNRGNLDNSLSEMSEDKIEHLNLDYNLSDELPNIAKVSGENLEHVNVPSQIFENLREGFDIDNAGDIGGVVSHADIVKEKITVLKPDVAGVGDGILNKIDHIIDSLVDKLPGH